MHRLFLDDVRSRFFRVYQFVPTPYFDPVGLSSRWNSILVRCDCSHASVTLPPTQNGLSQAEDSLMPGRLIGIIWRISLLILQDFLCYALTMNVVKGAYPTATRIHYIWRGAWTLECHRTTQGLTRSRVAPSRATASSRPPSKWPTDPNLWPFCWQTVNPLGHRLESVWSSNSVGKLIE